MIGDLTHEARWRRPARHAIALAACVVAGTAAGGCNAEDMVATLREADPAFVVSPVALADLASIAPLGEVDPPRHALPADHVHLRLAAGAGPRRVMAPGDGVVLRIQTRASGDQRVWVQASRSVTYYIDHIALSGAIEPDRRIMAGQVLGTAPAGAAVGFGVFDERTPNPGLLARDRYAIETLHARAPLPLFAEPLRAQLYARVECTGPDHDGRVGHDVAGTLAGNWFAGGPRAAGAPGSFLASAEVGPRLAFVPDAIDPAVARVSIDGPLAVRGLFAVAPAEPRFAAVTPALGRVRYTLRAGPTGPVAGTLLVQLTAPDRLTIEAFAPGADASAFTSAALTFVR